MSLKVVELNDFDPPLLQKLIGLQNEAFGPLGLDKGTLPIMIRCGRVFVLEEDSNVIGSAELMREWSETNSLFLVGFSIGKRHRGKGLGRVFLQEVLKRVRSEGSRLRLTVSAKNKAAVNLYEGLGFKEIEFCRDEYGPGEDRLLMELRWQ